MQGAMMGFWVFVFIFMLIVEAITMGLVSIWFAVGAISALIAAALGVTFPVQFAIFFLISGILLAVLFPVVRNKLNARKTATNADRIIGREAIVTETIDAVSGKGQICVNGSVWSARTPEESKIDVGEQVIVESISGVKAVVIRKEQTE